MSVLTRKQREIQAREQLLLDVAERMLLERGYLGINMDMIAAATEYSKGTIYQHFTCKEDLIAAVLVRSMALRERLFAKAATFSGRPRERMTAIGVADGLFERVHPEHDRVEQLAKVDSIWEKASETRRSQFLRRDDNCMGIVKGIIRDGVAQGDLDLQPDLSVEGLFFGLWAMATGARTILATGLLAGVEGFENPETLLNRNYQIFLDGYGWKPLSVVHDYAATVERARQEVFQDEIRALQ